MVIFREDKVEFIYTKVRFLYARLIIVDEASMVSEEVFNDLLSFAILLLS